MLLHRNVLANVEQNALWVERRLPHQAEARQSHLCLRAAALPHLRAHHERADGHAAGRQQRHDPQPARHSRLRQGDAASIRSTSSRGSTRCSTRCSTTRISEARLHAADADARPAAWRCSAPSPSAGRRRPAARSSRATGCPRPRRSRPPTRSARPSSPARSACRCPRPRSPSATTTATICRSARSARSASAGRR